MQYSFSTVYMAIISSNILLILIALFFLNKKIMINMGYKLLAIFIGFCFLRFLLPFEFPFVIRVVLPEWLSLIIVRIRHPFSTFAGYDISVWTILQVIWVIGIMVGIFLYLLNYKRSNYKIMTSSLDVTDNEQYQRILNQVCKERKKKNNFRILETTGIISPMASGVFKPVIMLPEYMEFTDEDLYYVFSHESSHHFHHDLIVKHCIALISIVYWWNPMCYILKRKANSVLEMHVDDKITFSNPQMVYNYLNCLMGLMNQAMEKSIKNPLTGKIIGIDMVLMNERFSMLTGAKEKKKKLLNIAAFLLAAGLFVWSYLYIYEGSYIPDEIEENTHRATEENSYAVLKEDGTYDVYYNGYFIENTDSLECYSSEIPIYTEKEFLNEKP